MSSVETQIKELNEGGSLLVLVLSTISMLTGGIGLILNMVIFSRASMRREPCVIYLLSSTFFSLIYVLILQPVRLLAVRFNIDEANYNLVICKIEFYIFYISRSSSSWFIVLACIDRYIHSSSNARIRRLSSLKMAKISVTITTVIIFLIHSHMIIYYEIGYSADQYGNITGSCFGRKGTYRTFIGFWNLTLYSFCPSILMLLFGLLTLNNVRQRHRLVPGVTEINRNNRRTDIQLLRMLIAQVFVIFICTLPISIHQLYTSLTLALVKSSYRIAQEGLSGRITSVVTYYAHSSTFYLYTLTGTMFRKELFKLTRKCLHLKQHTNTVTPGGTREMKYTRNQPT